MLQDRASTTVIIVGGGGTLGSSTALHLVRSGYTPSNITLLDVYDIPSPQSAGNDLNKIVGPRFRNVTDVEMNLEAMEMWEQDVLFQPFYHKVGKLDCAHTPEDLNSLRAMYHGALESGQVDPNSIHWLETIDEILARMPLLSKDQIQDWKGVYWDNAGWVAASKALDSVGRYLKSVGVEFACGSAGTMKQPLIDGDRCIGVETMDGTVYRGDKIVLAAGAWTAALVDLEGQCVAKAWVVGHLQMDPKEASAYKNCPVVYNENLGFFFEPDENGVIKVCDQSPGLTRHKLHQPFGSPHARQLSVPRSQAKHPTDTIPFVSDRNLRAAIAAFLPQHRERKFVHQGLCWCADTEDRNLLLCEHPQWRNLVLATGDSGQSFKLYPVIGKYIVQVIEETLDKELAHAWRWRPGGDALRSTRGREADDLGEFPGWRHDEVEPYSIDDMGQAKA